MCSGEALTVTAIVPAYVGSTRRLSPAMRRVRSDSMVPQRLIHRRIGNQYNIARVTITSKVGTMGSPFSERSRGRLRHGPPRGRAVLAPSSGVRAASPDQNDADGQEPPSASTVTAQG